MLFKNENELKLWPVQEKILAELRQTMKHHRRTVLMASTGLGKTEIAVQIIKNAVERDKRVCFVCHRINLVYQTSERLYHYGVLHGIIQADHPEYFPNRLVQVASIQTLIRRKQDKFDIYIFDECHVQFSGHRQIIENRLDSFFIGLSATPYAKGLGKYFTGLCHPVSMKSLISDGVLKSFEAYGPDTIDLTGVKTVAGDYKKDDLEHAADKPKLVADIVETWLKHARDKKTMVFSSGVAHGRSLEKEFQRNGIRAREVNGYMPKETQGDAEGANKIIEDFRNGKYQVIISAEMLVAGFDVTDVSCVVLATATKSEMKFCQAVGRGIRRHDGIEKCIVLDHGSNFQRLGWPDDIEAEFDELDDGKKKEKKNKKKEKPEKLPKVCPSCDYLKPSGVHVCPACGFVAKHIEPIETEEGELKKLKRKAKNYSMQEKQSFLAQLNQYAENKGYKKGRSGCFGWALMKYSEKFGCQPSSRMDWKAKENTGVEVLKYIQHQNIKYAKAKGKLWKQKAFSCPACGCAQTAKRVTGTVECKACGKVVNNA
jgi:superfamily II DNA or RNA helicase